MNENGAEVTRSRERELLPGEAVLINIEGRDGRKPSFSVVGMRDKDGRATYLPIFAQMSDSEGNPNDLARILGIEKFKKSDIGEEERVELFSSLYVLPPLLAVDRVFNGNPIDDKVEEYTVSPDMIPVQLVGVQAPPQTGKTTFLATIAMASWGERRQRSSVRVVDLDDFSPESLNQTVEWLVAHGYHEKSNIVELHDAINSRFAELRNEVVPRVRNQSVTLRERLAVLRNNYRADHQTHTPGDTPGMVHKNIWMVDLPGISVDKDGRINERRRLDLFDALALSMPSVALFKAGEELQTWELPLMHELVNRQIESVMRGFEVRLSDMESSLLGMNRAEFDQMMWQNSGMYYLSLADLESAGSEKGE